MMYADDGTRRGSGLGEFLIRVLIVFAFIGLVLWLYPRPEPQNQNQNLPNLKTFYDDVFNRNVGYMRDAAVNYYTVDKLPQVDGQTFKMTLQDLLDKHLILPFTDKKGETCDTIGSYVEVTKQVGKLEYMFKINLSCPASNQENYLLEYRGCYDLCTTGTCETKPIKIVKPIERVQTTSPIVNVRANTCEEIGEEFGSATFSIARRSTDASFTYSIRVRQPGSLFYTTVAGGTINSSNASVTRTINATNNGGMDYQILINGQVYRSGTLSMNECREEPNEPNPRANAAANSCIVGSGNYGSGVFSMARGENDPAFTYSIRVRQPNASSYSTIDSGTLSASNPSVTRTVNSTTSGYMYYQFYVNGSVYSSGSVYIDFCPAPLSEYLHRRDVTTSYWTAYSDWSLTQTYASNTRRVQTIDYYRGYKWIPSLVYEYQQRRVVDAGYTAWSSWSAWQTTPVSVTTTRDVDTRTVTDRIQTGTRTNYGNWTYQRKERRTSMYASAYNTGSASTATEYRQYLGMVVVRDCSGCSLTIYYEYSIYTRSRTTDPIYDYRSRVEYRYRTRSPIQRAEYVWTNTRTVSGWTYTGNSRVASSTGYYAESGWLQLSDWNTLLADGYTFYARRTYYTYSDLVTTTTSEYKWTRNISEPGWIYTGTSRQI